MADLGRRKHGTESAYAGGCRCDRCRNAARIARADRKARSATATKPQRSDHDAGVTAIGTARGNRRKKSTAALAPVPPAGPSTVEEAVNEFVKDFEHDPGVMFDITLARRLAHEIDSPSTSMSVAPIVTQLRDLMAKLEKQRTGGNSGAGLGGLRLGAR